MKERKTIMLKNKKEEKKVSEEMAHHLAETLKGSFR